MNYGAHLKVLISECSRPSSNEAQMRFSLAGVTLDKSSLDTLPKNSFGLSIQQTAPIHTEVPQVLLPR